MNVHYILAALILGWAIGSTIAQIKKKPRVKRTPKLPKLRRTKLGLEDSPKKNKRLP